MKTTRREFLLKSVLAVTGAALIPFQSNNSVMKKKAGRITALQLYCVRDEMKQDPLGTLTKLAKLGYTHVEHASYVDHKFYGWTAPEFKKVLGDLGLKMPSGHTVLEKNHWDAAINDFTDDWKKLVNNAAFMGQKYVISPWLDTSLRQSYNDLMQFMEVFNKCGELCKKSGMRFGYHNHDFEFSEKLNGESLFDLIMKNTDADKVVMQLDMGNMFIAGAFAKDILGRYPGRYDNIHVKDMIKTETGFESTILGEGLVGTRAVTDMARKMGTTLFVIEQESYQGKTPLECMEKDHNVMKSWGYRS
jgi:sugar phosphate isomerase/epimerase